MQTPQSLSTVHILERSMEGIEGGITDLLSSETHILDTPFFGLCLTALMLELK